MFNNLHQNFLHLVCYVLHRMGFENCEKNVWAVALKDIVYNKCRKHKGDEFINMSEEDRNK